MVSVEGGRRLYLLVTPSLLAARLKLASGLGIGGLLVGMCVYVSVDKNECECRSSYFMGIKKTKFS